MAHKTAEFDQMVERLMEEFHVPGVSIAIVQGDEIDAKAYGYAKFPDKKCTTETIFDLASVSKSTTAGAVACLVDDDTNHPDVQWQTPVSKLLPEDFVLPTQSLTDQVTVEDILSHRTGISTHDESYLGVTAQNPDNAATLTRNLRNLPFTEPLRTKSQYSNIMFTAASHLVSTLSGLDYPTFLRTHLWDPLDMTDTFHDRPAVAAAGAEPRSAQGYRWSKDSNSYFAVPPLPSPEGQGAGCILTTPTSYAKWLRALINRTGPLSEKAHKALVTPRTIEDIPEDPEDRLPHYGDELYALGLCRENFRGYTLIDHGGSVPGYKAKLAFFPQKKWGIICCTNANKGWLINSTITHWLFDRMLGVPEEDRVDWEKIFREREAKGEKEDEEMIEKEEWKRPEGAEELGVPMEAIAGRYWNEGYKGISVQMREGKVVADCTDRCFPFEITFGHLTGKKLVAEMHDLWDDYSFKKKAEVKVDDKGRIVALGIGFEDEMKDLIWFDRVED